ncbi:MAG: hypothetical protein U9R50_09610 [Campylobacterota bacterium]|nr:hypothetical protein [Campylobacterota bacterium]
MKYRFILLILLVSSTLFSRESHRNQITTVPDISRYSIIQSELSADMTFRLDKYTGIVSRMLEGNKGTFWLKLKREKHANDIQSKNSVNYQIFASGLNIQMIYLLNVHTGVTWELSENSKLGIFWKVIR